MSTQSDPPRFASNTRERCPKAIKKPKFLIDMGTQCSKVRAIDDKVSGRAQIVSTEWAIATWVNESGDSALLCLTKTTCWCVSGPTPKDRQSRGVRKG